VTGTARTRLAILLVVTMAVSALMPFVLGALGPAIKADLGLTRNELGALSAVHYFAAAVLSTALGGRIDGIDPRVSLTAVFVGGGATLGLLAITPSFGLLLLAIVPAGAVAAAGNPACNKVIAGLSGPRGVLTGLKQSGVQVGGFASGALLPALTTLMGWRAALACVGAVCAAGTVFVRWLPRAPVPVAKNDAADEPPQPSPVFRRLAVYAFFMGMGISAIMAFLPLYGAERAGIGVATAGVLLAVVSIAGMASAPAWGSWAERRAAADGHANGPLAVIALSAVAATALIAAAEPLGAWTLWLGALLMGVGGASWNAAVMQVLISQGPAGSAGRASGRVMTAMFAGLFVSAPVFGALVDATDDYLAGWGLVVAAFGAAALVAGPFAGRSTRA
jgi:MFS family permease